MNTNYLISISPFQDYRRTTLSCSSIYLIVLNNRIIFFNIHDVYFWKHLDLRISFFFKFFLTRISTNTKLKLNLFVIINIFFFIQFVISTFLKIWYKIILVIFFFLFFFIVFDVLLQTTILILIKLNKSYIISICIIFLTPLKFALQIEIFFLKS